MILSPHEIAYVAATVPWTLDERVDAVAVALAESAGDTDKMARSGAKRPDGTPNPNVGQRAHGLWMISGNNHGDKLQAHPNWRNPYENAVMAYMIFEAAGRKWTPWHVTTNGPPATYLQFLPDAQYGVRWPFKPATLGDRL